MRRVGFLLIVLALVAGCDDNDNPNGPTTGPIVFTATLSPANEVPPITSAEDTGRGFVIITFDVPRDGSGAVTGAGNATFEIQTSGFPDGTPARLAHIHPGATGVNGGVLVNTGLTPADPITMGSGTVTRTLTARGYPGGRHQHRRQPRRVLLQRPLRQPRGRRDARPAGQTIEGRESSARS